MLGSQGQQHGVAESAIATQHFGAHAATVPQKASSINKNFSEGHAVLLHACALHGKIILICGSQATLPVALLAFR